MDINPDIVGDIRKNKINELTEQNILLQAATVQLKTENDQLQLRIADLEKQLERHRPDIAGGTEDHSHAVPRPRKQ